MPPAGGGEGGEVHLEQPYLELDSMAPEANSWRPPGSGCDRRAVRGRLGGRQSARRRAYSAYLLAAERVLPTPGPHWAVRASTKPNNSCAAPTTVARLSSQSTAPLLATSRSSCGERVGVGKKQKGGCWPGELTPPPLTSGGGSARCSVRAGGNDRAIHCGCCVLSLRIHADAADATAGLQVLIAVT